MTAANKVRPTDTTKAKPKAVKRPTDMSGKRVGGAKPGVSRKREARPVNSEGVAGLTPSEERFAALVLGGESQSAAYLVAFPQSKRWTPKTVASKASTLAATERVRGRIAEGAKAAADANNITAAEVIQIAAAIARFDFRKMRDENGALRPDKDIDNETALAVAGFECIDQFEGIGADRRMVGVLKKVKTADKNVAITNLMKHFGLFEKDNEQQAGVFDPEALAAKFGDAMQKAMDRQAAMLEERRKRRAGG